MADDDFDIEGLAAYLHLAPAQVGRLVERGHLPGRRVAGQWRFSASEIHHWLETRIGLSEEEELHKMETALGRRDDAVSESWTLASELPLCAIDLALPARTRNSAIESMVELAAQTGWLWDPAKMIAAVRAREDMHPTALENGVALLHPRRPLSQILERPFLALGRTDRGIPFGGSRGVLTDVFFLICSVDDTGHLQTLARLSRLIGAESFLNDLRATANAQAAHELIAAREQALPA